MFVGSWSLCAHLCLGVVDGRCGRLMVILGGRVICCVLAVFVGVHWLLLEVIVVGQWSPCVVVEHWWSGAVVVIHCLLMVVVRRKEATSHIVTMALCLNIHMRSHVNDLTCNDLT